MLLLTVLAAALVSTDTAAPSPQASIPTIAHTHSSPYCTALRRAVDPVLVGLMSNDQLITVGLNALHRMDHDFKYGGMEVDSWGATGAPTHQLLPGKVTDFDHRLQQTATALQHNADAVDALLANTDTSLKPANADEQAALASIKAQLTKVADQQKTAINLINGVADTQELDAIFNGAAAVAPSYTVAVGDYHADTLGGISPIEAMLSKGEPEMGIKGDPTLTVKMMKAKAQTSGPFQSPYERFVQALTDDQLIIGSYENAASKSVIAGAAGCK